AGYAEQAPGSFRLLNDPISEERWGVGLKEGEIASCQAVDRVIAQMWRDGTAARLLRKWFGRTGLELPTSQPPSMHCY
ncbi:transporter substrate-binding domain-containing protein, partial [Nonomuraea deserti]